MAVLRNVLVLALLAVGAMAPAAADEPRSIVTNHRITLAGKSIPYRAFVEDVLVNDGSGKPGADLVLTSYVRSDLKEAGNRPVVFLFNGGPSVAAIGVHAEFGPLAPCRDGKASRQPANICISDNPASLIDVADLVMFDPAETGFSRLIPGGDRDYFYSTAGDANSLVQEMPIWLQRHQRTRSPLFLLGESYGSIRQVVAADLLSKRGTPITGEIILGNSIFLSETLARTRNILSNAVSLPVIGLTAAYHGKADMHGKNVESFFSEVYNFAIGDYFLALAKGNSIDPAEKSRIAARLERYTGIPARYYLDHDLMISKSQFYRMLLPGRRIDQYDTRVTHASSEPEGGVDSSEAERLFAKEKLFYKELLTRLNFPSKSEYSIMAPESFERWNWGPGCSAALKDAALCSERFGRPSVFNDYDWPGMLKRQFDNPAFRTIVIGAYYDGLSSVGTQRYLETQLDYPADRFTIKNYAAGHMTGADPVAQPLLINDLKTFLTRGK